MRVAARRHAPPFSPGVWHVTASHKDLDPSRETWQGSARGQRGRACEHRLGMAQHGEVHEPPVRLVRGEGRGVST